MPTAPETVYDNIAAAEAPCQGNTSTVASMKPVLFARFVEKPDRAQNLKAIKGRPDREGASKSKTHNRSYRPWGIDDGIAERERWQVKKIVANPGASLSLQMHQHRAQHLIIVGGTSLVEKDGLVELPKENQSTHIPRDCQHHLSTPGHIPMEMIKVEKGTYLRENHTKPYNTCTLLKP